MGIDIKDTKAYGLVGRVSSRVYLGKSKVEHF